VLENVIEAVGPGSLGRPDPDHSCDTNDYWGSVVFSERPFTRLRICIREPGEAWSCFKGRTFRGKDRAAFVGTPWDEPGSYLIKWRLRGHRRIDHARMQIRDAR
jgi:hypothetical protein